MTVLMTSPWPESLLAFRRIWTQLEPLARLVAIDLPGFGQSELRERIANSTLVNVDTVHFAWELKPEEYGASIAEWISGGYRDSG